MRPQLFSKQTEQNNVILNGDLSRIHTFINGLPKRFFDTIQEKYSTVDFTVNYDSRENIPSAKSTNCGKFRPGSNVELNMCRTLCKLVKVYKAFVKTKAFVQLHLAYSYM